MGNWSRRQVLGSAALAAGAALLRPFEAASAAAAADELAFESAVALARRLRAGDIGSVELTRYYIDRIERYDKAINAVVVRDFERALQAAEAADRALAAGRPLGPLHGLPMTIKESYDIAGLPTTWGFPAAADNIALSDAVVVSRLKDAGAHFMGKTNVPIALGDFQSYNEIYGTTGNPWDLERTPGGSSGGTAAALAAGLTGLDCGSDIGGSIRNPAHFCGVYGHKPTWGIVPSRGQAPPGVASITPPDLAVVGPLGRSAEDLALTLDVIAGPDVLAAPGWSLELPPPRATTLAGLRVAILPDHPRAPVATEISDRLVALGRTLAARGAKVSDSARPELDLGEAFDTYQRLLLAIVGGAEDNIDHRAWLALDGARGEHRMRWQAFFRDWDVLLAPIMATTAFPHDHQPFDARTVLVDGEPAPYFAQLFWAGIPTLSYLPATVFPTGAAQDGLPIGFQAVGAELADRTTIEFARLVAVEMGGFVAPPGYG